MPIQVDVWGGDLHQSLVAEFLCDGWSEAAGIIEQHVDAGNLVNVVHTDFKAPNGMADEALLQLMAAETQTPGQ